MKAQEENNQNRIAKEWGEKENAAPRCERDELEVSTAKRTRQLFIFLITSLDQKRELFELHPESSGRAQAVYP